MQSLAVFGVVVEMVLLLLGVGFIVLMVILMKNTKNPPKILKLVYLYILSFVGLVITVVSSIGMIDLVLKNYVFQVSPFQYVSSCQPPYSAEGKPGIIDQVASDKEKNDELKRQLSSQLAGMLVGLPLWLYHWGLIRKQKDEE